VLHLEVEHVWSDDEHLPEEVHRPNDEDQRATFVTVSQVRVVRSFPSVFSMSVMKTGPFGLGT
jgi:hypothetical protein